MKKSIPQLSQSMLIMLIHFIYCIRDSDFFPWFWPRGHRWRAQLWAQPPKVLQPMFLCHSVRPLQVQAPGVAVPGQTTPPHPPANNFANQIHLPQVSLVRILKIQTSYMAWAMPVILQLEPLGTCHHPRVSKKQNPMNPRILTRFVQLFCFTCFTHGQFEEIRFLKSWKFRNVDNPVCSSNRIGESFLFVQLGFAHKSSFASDTQPIETSPSGWSLDLLLVPLPYTKRFREFLPERVS